MRVYHRYVLIVVMVLLLPAFSGMYGCSQNNADTQESKKSGASREADRSIAELLKEMSVYHFESQVKAPDFNLTSVKGGNIGLNQYQGKVVLLSFWATW